MQGSQFGASIGSNVRYDFADKVAVLIGAGSGLTRGIAQALGAAGADLVLCDVNEDGVEQTARGIVDAGGRAVALQVDVANHADMERLFVAADQLGPVGMMVNGAYVGSGHQAPEVVDLDNWRRVMDVNINGAFIATQQLVDA